MSIRKVIWTSATLMLMIIGVGCFLFYQDTLNLSKDDQLTQSNKRERTLVEIVPAKTQLVLDLRTIKLNINPIVCNYLSTIPYFSIFRELVHEEAGFTQNPICALQASQVMTPLFICANDEASNRVVSTFLVEQTYSEDVREVSIDRFQYSLYSTQSGEVITLYKSGDFLILSPSFNLVKDCVAVLEKDDKVDKTLRFLYDKTKAVTNNRSVIYFKPPIIPLGVNGESSLEEQTLQEWAMASIKERPKSLLISTAFLSKRLLNTPSLPCSWWMSRDAESTIYISKERILSTLECEKPQEKLSLYELYWNQEFINLLKQEVHKGANILTYKDRVTGSEQLLIVPIEDRKTFKLAYNKLLQDNKRENRSYLREEGIRGYWKTIVVPTPYSLRSILNLSNDKRLIYTYLEKDQFIITSNYQLLLAYQQRSLKDDVSFSFISNPQLVDNGYLLESAIAGDLKFIQKNPNNSVLIPLFLYTNRFDSLQIDKIEYAKVLKSDSILYFLNLTTP